QFQKFIDSKFTLDYDSQMTDTYFVEYTGLAVQHFRDTLLQHLGNVKKSVAERTCHQTHYGRKVNKRQMQTQESKIDTDKALDADLVDTESIRTDSTVQDDSNRSGNDTDADDADIRPIYDEELMAEVQLTAECNIFAIGQQHTEQPKIIVEGRVDQYPETCQVKIPMLDRQLNTQNNHSRQHGQILNETSNKSKIEKEIDVLETMNIELEHSVATLCKENETLKQHYKDLYDSIKITRSKTREQTTSLLANNAELKAQIQEKVFAIAALKNDLRKLKETVFVDTKFDKTSVLGKPVLQSPRNQSVVRQPNAFKSERPQMSKQRFASQVDVETRVESSSLLVLRLDSQESYRTLAQARLTLNSHMLNVDILNIHECKQTLDLSTELESLFGPLFDEYLSGENQVVLKSFAVTTADASDKCQQQPDSTSSSSALATTVTAEGNFDM
ncbi:hypothetical protein Tco_1447873, partial [Tanacetum coccineum]